MGRRQHASVVTQGGGPTRVKREWERDCDINRIVKRHAQTGMWDHLAAKTPLYGDFAEYQDLQTATEAVQRAQDEFMALPARVRAVAANDPVEFARMCATVEGHDALVEAGLPPGPDYVWPKDREGQQDDKGGKTPPNDPPGDGE